MESLPEEGERPGPQAALRSPSDAGVTVPAGGPDLTDPKTRAPARAAERSLSSPELIDEGLRAMKEGHEEKAHHLFAAATEVDGSNDTAWFWRARTSPDLDGSIASLRRVLELNPGNKKVRASLNLALDRQGAERARQRLTSSQPPAATALSSYVKPGPPRRPFLLHLASLGYLLLGVLWTAALLLPLFDEPLAALYREARVLPVLRMPYQSPWSLGLPDGTLPELNLFYLAPLSMAVLSFLAGEVLADRRRTASLYVLAVAMVSMVTSGLFVAGQAAAGLMLGCSALAAVTAVAGRAQYQRRIMTSSN